MNLSNKNRLIIVLLLSIIVFALSWILYKKCTSDHVVQFIWKHRSCSFNDIDACQSSHLTKRTFLYIIWGRAGFCSELNQILLAFAYSVSTKRRFIINSHTWNYGNFSDYFRLPSTNYYVQTNRTFIEKNNIVNNQIEHLQTTRIGSQVSRFWFATQSVQSIPIKRQVAHYLWKSISNETFQFIQTNRMQNLSNYIGIHTRRGDKLVSEARPISINKYISTIEQLIKTNKTSKQIYVASDDYSVIRTLRQLKPTWTFFSLFDGDQKRTLSGHVQNHFNRLSHAQKVFETRLFMCELQMLIDAKYVLCGMSSNVCRLVQILRYQHPSTTISLDRGWYGT